MTHTPPWFSLRKTCFGIVCLLGCFLSTLQAQDPSFSQFYANRIYLNPAFAGIERGITLNSVARAQWMTVDQGFRTYGASLETQLPVARLGLGLHLMRNEEGFARFTTNQAGLAFAYTIPGENNNLHFGFEGRFVQKSLDWDRLRFSDQIDPVYGFTYPTAVAPVLDRVIFGDLSAGFVWRHQGKVKMGRNVMRQVHSHLGISFHHLPNFFSRAAKGNDSFLNLEAGVAPRTTFHGGWIIPLRYFKAGSQEIAISPNFKFDMQGYELFNFKNNITVGTVGAYALVSQFYFGVLYQNKYYAPSTTHTDAFIITAGGYTGGAGDSGQAGNRLFFGLSADLNNTGLGPAAGSVFEATFRYVFDVQIRANARARGRRSGSRVLDCRHFF